MPEGRMRSMTSGRLQGGALAELRSENHVRSTTRVAEMSGGGVVEAGEVPEDHIGDGLHRVRVSERVVAQCDVAFDPVSDETEPAARVASDRHWPGNVAVLEGRVVGATRDRVGIAADGGAATYGRKAA